MRTRLVGIDCATQDTKVGVAYGDFSDGQLAVVEAFACTKEKTAAEAISNWLQELKGPVLLAIDAPLGWPQPLSRVLANQPVRSSPLKRTIYSNAQPTIS
jgi:predicted RNase H-like nuclease